MRRLEAQTADLREQLRILTAAQGAGRDAAQAVATSESSSIPETTAASDGDSEAHSFHEFRGIEWRGFGEADYKVLDQRRPELGTQGFVPGSAGNFFTGDFDLFLNSKLTDRTNVLGELVFEEGDAQSYRVDLRRVLLNFEANDHLRMSFGRYQTGIGYYNWAFRSAPWLQTTVDRPLVMEYSSRGGVLPTQAVGVSVTGAIPSGKLGLHYVAEYGSSDTIRPDIDGSGVLDDENNGNHVLAGFFVRPDWAHGIQAGGSFFHDEITSNETSPNDRLGQTILNAYFAYYAHGIEVLSEGFLIRHCELHGPLVMNMPAFYSQVSQQIGRFRPYVRYQYINANPRSLFWDVALRHGPSFGSRLDLNDSMAFTAQMNHIFRKGQPDLNGLQLQFSFTF